MTDLLTPYAFQRYEIAPIKSRRAKLPPFVLESRARLERGETVYAHNDRVPCPRCLKRCDRADHAMAMKSRRFQVTWTAVSGVAAVLLGLGYYFLREQDPFASFIEAFEAFMVLAGLVWAASPTYHRAGGFGGLGRYSKRALVLFILAFASYVVYAVKVYSDLISAAMQG